MYLALALELRSAKVAGVRCDRHRQPIVLLILVMRKTALYENARNFKIWTHTPPERFRSHHFGASWNAIFLRCALNPARRVGASVRPRASAHRSTPEPNISTTLEHQLRFDYLVFEFDRCESKRGSRCVTRCVEATLLMLRCWRFQDFHHVLIIRLVLGEVRLWWL